MNIVSYVTYSLQISACTECTDEDNHVMGELRAPNWAPPDGHFPMEGHHLGASYLGTLHRAPPVGPALLGAPYWAPPNGRPLLDAPYSTPTGRPILGTHKHIRLASPRFKIYQLS